MYEFKIVNKEIKTALSLELPMLDTDIMYKLAHLVISANRLAGADPATVHLVKGVVTMLKLEKRAELEKVVATIEEREVNEI